MSNTDINTKRYERRLLLFIFIIFFPLVSIALVGGYGFIIWLLQIFFGPPGA